MKCPVDDTEFDPAKDFYLTLHERKGPSIDLCSLVCAQTYVED